VAKEGCHINNDPILVLPYILESNPHPFYSFRGLKNHIWIWMACGLDSRLWAGFWKNDRAAVYAIRTIQYNNLLFYLLFIILYNILYNIYKLLFVWLTVITHYWIIIRHSVTIIFGSIQSIAYATLLERSDDNAIQDGFPCSRHPLRDFWRSFMFDFSSFC